MLVLTCYTSETEDRKKKKKLVRFLLETRTAKLLPYPKENPFRCLTLDLNQRIRLIKVNMVIS